MCKQQLVLCKPNCDYINKTCALNNVLYHCQTHINNTYDCSASGWSMIHMSMIIVNEDVETNTTHTHSGLAMLLHITLFDSYDSLRCNPFEHYGVSVNHVWGPGDSKTHQHMGHACQMITRVSGIHCTGTRCVISIHGCIHNGYSIWVESM